MLKIVLLGYSRGLISSRTIEAACRQNVLFMTISGDSAPAYTSIAKFVREMGEEIRPLFSQVLKVCDEQGLIGRQMFAIDGVKLPSNASKERGGTHEELLHRARRLDKAAAKILQAHRQRDDRGDRPEEPQRRMQRMEELSREADRMREFVANNAPRRNAKKDELKSNVTDPDSAKMATSKGVIQGQAAVDNAHQVIVAAEVLNSGAEQAALLPMVQVTDTVRVENTLITADAGYHSNENMKALRDKGIPALVADNEMRMRDERFAGHGKHKAKPDLLSDKTGKGKRTKKVFQPTDFKVDAQMNACICAACEKVYSSGSNCRVNGWVYRKFNGTKRSCVPCELRDRCLRHPDKTQIRQVAIFHAHQPRRYEATVLIRQVIDTERGRRIYSEHMGTVEWVFANLRHNKKLNRFTLRGQCKVTTQWQLYCVVNNIEKLAGCLRTRWGTLGAR